MGRLIAGSSGRAGELYSNSGALVDFRFDPKTAAKLLGNIESFGQSKAATHSADSFYITTALAILEDLFDLGAGNAPTCILHDKF